MSERLIYCDSEKAIYVVTEATDDAPQVERIEWTPGREPIEQRVAAVEKVLTDRGENITAARLSLTADEPTRTTGR